MSDNQQPSGAFIAASWVALLAGFIAYLAMLVNSTLDMNERGFYFILLMYGLFAAVSVQKSVRDRAEGVPVTAIYSGLAWVSVLVVLVALGWGLFNAQMPNAEKGFYAMSYLLSLFAAIAVQKNTRDKAAPVQSVVSRY